jgi:hypothetical protein
MRPFKLRRRHARRSLDPTCASSVEPHKLGGDQTPVGGGNRLSTVDPALDHDAIAAEMAIDSSKRNRDKKSDFVEVFDQLKLPLQRRC